MNNLHPADAPRQNALRAAAWPVAIVACLSAWLCSALGAGPSPASRPATTPATGPAQERPRTVQVTTRDSTGAELRVPKSDRPTLLLFLRGDQEQSQRTVEDARSVLRDRPGAQVLAIFSGKDMTEPAKKFASLLPWSVVMDEEYGLVGQLHVHVWPTSILVSGEGKELARLTGMSQSYARDLAAYLEFAAGKIDQQTLQNRLGAADMVADSAQQMANRHFQVAQMLLEKGLAEQAGQELDRGLKLRPQDPRLQLAKAKVLLLLGDPPQAKTILDRLDEKTANPGELRALRGALLLAMSKWDEAIPVLQSAVKLNPNPAEAYYFLGLAYQQRKQWPEATDAFRAAFEATAAGRVLAPPFRPTTRPGGKS
jgi:Tfp pilus assembly protein PilF